VHDTLRETCERRIRRSPEWPRCRASQFRILACGRGAASNEDMRHRAHSCREQGAVFGKPIHSRLDAVASSAEPKERQYCCSVSKNFSKRRVVPPALPPALLTKCSPRCQPPTRPKMRFESPYGPQVAVSSIPPGCHEASYSGSLDDAGLLQEERQGSVKENVSKQRTVPMALSPIIQVRDSPVSPDLTWSPTRYKSLYGPQLAVPSINP
jgi:hypothetical protein